MTIYWVSIMRWKSDLYHCVVLNRNASRVYNHMHQVWWNKSCLPTKIIFRYPGLFWWLFISQLHCSISLMYALPETLHSTNIWVLNSRIAGQCLPNKITPTHSTQAFDPRIELRPLTNLMFLWMFKDLLFSWQVYYDNVIFSSDLASWPK